MKVKRNANDNFALIFVLPRCKNKRGLCSLGEVCGGNRAYIPM